MSRRFIESTLFVFYASLFRAGPKQFLRLLCGETFFSDVVDIEVRHLHGFLELLRTTLSLKQFIRGLHRE